MAFDVSKIHLLRKPENVHNHKGKDKTKFPRQTIKNFFAEKHNIIITTPAVNEIIAVLDRFLSEVAEKSVLHVKERGKVYVTENDVKYVIGLRTTTEKAKMKYKIRKLKKLDEQEEDIGEFKGLKEVVELDEQQAVEKSEGTGHPSSEEALPLSDSPSPQTQELPVVPIITETKSEPIETLDITPTE